MMSKDEKRIKHNARNNKWAKLNRSKVNVLHNNWRKKRRLFYLSLKFGKCCVKCGEEHPACLDFHHIEAENKESLIRKLAMSTSDNDAVRKEAEKCILLCANCHRKEHYKEPIL